MTIKAGLYAFLGSQSSITDVVGSRIYHRELPQKPTYPALVYSIISDNAISHTHDGFSGPWRARFQIEVYTESAPVADALMKTVYDALDEYAGAMGTYSITWTREAGLNPDLSFRDESTLKWVEGRSADFLTSYHRT